MHDNHSLSRCLHPNSAGNSPETFFTTRDCVQSLEDTEKHRGKQIQFLSWVFLQQVYSLAGVLRGSKQFPQLTHTLFRAIAILICVTSLSRAEKVSLEFIATPPPPPPPTPPSSSPATSPNSANGVPTA